VDPVVTKSTRARFTLLFFLTLFANFGAACSAEHAEVVPDAPKGMTILRFAGAPSSQTSPGSPVASPSEAVLEASLHHIVVRYLRTVAFLTTDPTPLLTESQGVALGKILAQELPTVGPNGRVRIKFTDGHYGIPFVNEFDVTLKDNAVVYDFRKLAFDDAAAQGGDMQVRAFRAELVESAPGQKIVNQPAYATLVDPLPGEASTLAAEDYAKKSLFKEAQKDSLYAPDEEPKLLGYLQLPHPSADAWKAYWAKRRTLKTALEQGLMDQKGYSDQVERLTKELAQ
jgi:hypothetical protein